MIFKGRQAQHVVSGVYDDTKAVSCFGLPGFNLPPVYMYCDFWICAAVAGDNSVYIGITSGFLKQTTVVGTSFPSFVCVRPDYFVADPNNRAGEVISMTLTKPSSAVGNLDYTFPTYVDVPLETDVNPADYGLHYIGHLEDFHWVEGTTDGYCYLAGTAYYDVITGYNYPSAVQIILPDFKRFYDYFPGAIRSGSSWKSCNRSGGNFQIKQGGSWRDCKNQFGGASSSDTTFIKSSGSWVKSAKTGSE